MRRHWLCNRFASMHPASDVRYFVIMSRAMFIAILNGRRGGGRDLARISRDTRLLRCIRFVILVEKNITVFFLALFFFFFSLPLCGRVFMNRCRKLLETRFLHEARTNTSAYPLINPVVRDGRGRERKKKFAKTRIIIIIINTKLFDREGDKFGSSWLENNYRERKLEE